MLMEAFTLAEQAVFADKNKIYDVACMLYTEVAQVNITILILKIIYLKYFIIYSFIFFSNSNNIVFIIIILTQFINYYLLYF